MGGDTFHRRSPFFSTGCMSPSCVPVHEEYSSIDHGQDNGRHRNRILRKLLRRIVNESKTTIYGTTQKPSTFQYDAVSYSQNFDDGCRGDDECY